MQKLNEQSDFLLNLIRNCEYYDLSEKQSIDLINNIFSKPISRSTYYNYKRKLYQDEKYQALKKSFYNSKMLKSLMLYLDDKEEPDNCDIQKLIIEKFPEKKDIFEISEQTNTIKQFHSRINSNFCVGIQQNSGVSNLNRVNPLPEKYTLREEYVKCGNGKCQCNLDRHGPYYYAYWREKKVGQTKSKLRKKYLGTIRPRL